MLVNIADGRQIAEAVHPYANDVIDETLPDTSIRPWGSSDQTGCSSEQLARLLGLGIGHIETQADWR